MKKMMIAAALLLAMTAGRSFANNEKNINDDVLTAFHKSFGNAKNVEWKTINDIMKATFVLDGQIMFAYYKQTGEQLALTRNLLSGQLPINLMVQIKKKYNEYRITELFEVSANGETNYYITLQDAKYDITLKSEGANSWEKYKKQKRELE